MSLGWASFYFVLFPHFYLSLCSIVITVTIVLQNQPGACRFASGECYAVNAQRKSHPYCFQLSQLTMTKYKQSFHSISNLWNSLYQSVFPWSYNLACFKLHTSRLLDSITPWFSLCDTFDRGYGGFQQHWIVFPLCIEKCFEKVLWLMQIKMQKYLCIPDFLF